MLNPGKCLPYDEKQISDNWKEFEAKSDLSIRNVSTCVNGAYKNQLSGYVFIINLSDKRMADSRKLSHEEFTKEDLEIIKEMEDKLKEEEEKGNSIKWIWIAFGKIYEDGNCPAKHNKRNELKKRVLNKLKEIVPDKIVGYSISFTHPGIPLNVNAAKKFEIIKEIRGKLENF